MNTYFSPLVMMFCTIISLYSAAGEMPISEERQAINVTLDAFHQAAADADFDRYFSLLTKDAIFLGTDASERWTKSSFKTFVKPYFSKGQGWLYMPTKRYVSSLANKDVVFFDELLENKSYGQTRGSGVLVKTQQGWKIAQYNLSIPMPNGIAKHLVKQIKAFQPKGSSDND